MQGTRPLRVLPFIYSRRPRNVSHSPRYLAPALLSGPFRFDLIAFSPPPMGRITLGVFAFWVFLSVVFLAGAEVNSGAEVAGEEKKPSFAEVLLSRVFSSSVSTSPPATVSYWDKVRALVTHVRGHFYSPNVDFRGVDESEVGEVGSGRGGKVKEAVSRSLEKSVETVEDSAKSAAKIASETVKKTKEKVKKSLSGRGSEDDRPEL